MPQIHVVSEHVRFGKDKDLAGMLGYQATDEPSRAVLICSPHPNFGGDMENNVIAALGERLSAEAVTLRFDYRGVGRSRIHLPAGLSVFDYWENVEQILDYVEPLSDTASAIDELAAITAGLPMIAVGYSFGAIMATQLAVRDPRIVAMVAIAPPLKRVAFEHLADCQKPCLIVSGTGDFVFDAEKANKLVEIAGRHLTFERPIGDHFFIGMEGELADRVAKFAVVVTAAV